ncbi:HERV-H LTR-associating protein 1 [Engystomops pustulosus]|uniref:HERV-H LTR-associating protein 1 n=1 Tax=Engystomops pustulosus TaxID=76066 RepID=UPI003AFA2B79
MPWREHISTSIVLSVICFLLFYNIGPSLMADNQREKRLAILGTTEIPAASVDLSQFNFTDLVNGMLNMALRGTKQFFSFLSVTSYSSFAFHKVSILIYNISNLKYVDYHKFPMRYCYCLNNRTNDLTDYTLLLLDIVGNSSSSLKELFKSTSIVSVSQSNESDCIYFCVMTGRTGRNLSDLWDLTLKPPVVNLTFPRNNSSALDLDSILPNLIVSAENTEYIKSVPTELWTRKTSISPSMHEDHHGIKAVTSQYKSQQDLDLGQATEKSLGESEISVGKQSSSASTTEEVPLKVPDIPPTKSLPFIHKIYPTRFPSLKDTIAEKSYNEPSDKLSLLPPNTLKDQGVLFLSHKAQDGSSLKIPGWTTIAALEMLQRPYTMMPIWTERGLQDHNILVTTRRTVSEGQVPRTNTRPLIRTSSKGTDTRQTMVSAWVPITSLPHRRTSLAMTPLRADSDIYDLQKGLTTRRITRVTNEKIHPIPSVTPPLLQILVPQLKPTVDIPRISFHSYTKTRCRQTKLEVTPPSVTSVVPRVTSCIMELCRFYQQCLCTNQDYYSRHKKQRQCIQFYTWYLRNATNICEKLQRKPHRHTMDVNKTPGMGSRRALKQKCLANICKSI